MKKAATYLLFLVTTVTVVAVVPAPAPSNIDAAHRFSWGENVGWMNWRHGAQQALGVVVDRTFLSDYIWCENIGWINVGNGNGPYANNTDADYGVNILPSGDLDGFAWGENVGWINFGTSILGPDRAHFDACNRRFLGYAWGENIGLINLDDATHFVAVGPCLVGDLDCDGTVALNDFADFATSMSGPDVSPACNAFDADNDDDVDLSDYAEVQRLFGTTP